MARLSQKRNRSRRLRAIEELEIMSDALPTTEAVATMFDSKSRETLHAPDSPSPPVHDAPSLTTQLEGYQLDPRYMEIPEPSAELQETEPSAELQETEPSAEFQETEPSAVVQETEPSENQPGTDLSDPTQADHTPAVPTEWANALQDSDTLWQQCDAQETPLPSEDFSSENFSSENFSSENFSSEDSSVEDSPRGAKSATETDEHAPLETEASSVEGPEQPKSKWEFLLTANSEMLAEVMDQVMELRESLDYVASTQALGLSAPPVPSPAPPQSPTEHESDYAQINKVLQDEVHDLRKKLEIVEQQNSDLASQIADESVRRTVSDSGGTSETLTWEERKEMMLRQMEDDSFDAEELLEDLKGESDVEDILDPADYLKQLHAELDTQRQRSEQQESEISQLKQLLQQQKDAGNDATLAAVIDADEVVQAEREKLRQLKEDWEARFRKTEIAASLERAKLSRERQQLEHETTKLQEQLAQLAHRTEQSESSGRAPSRRWLAKLGIVENEE